VREGLSEKNARIDFGVKNYFKVISHKSNDTGSGTVFVSCRFVSNLFQLHSS
jgi:hypothetical protein